MTICEENKYDILEYSALARIGAVIQELVQQIKKQDCEISVLKNKKLSEIDNVIYIVVLRQEFNEFNIEGVFWNLEDAENLKNKLERVYDTDYNNVYICPMGLKGNTKELKSE